MQHRRVFFFKKRADIGHWVYQRPGSAQHESLEMRDLQKDRESERTREREVGGTHKSQEDWTH